MLGIKQLDTMELLAATQQQRVVAIETSHTLHSAEKWTSKDMEHMELSSYTL